MSDAKNVKMKVFCSALVITGFITTCKSGIVVRCSDGTSGAEDGYALIVDFTGQTLTLYKYSAGVQTTLASVGIIIQDVGIDVFHVLGIECYENTITCYAVDADSEARLWDNPLMQVTDTTHTTGKCGLFVIDGLGRFDRVEVWAESDRYNPADTAEVEVKALLRGVNPHYE